MSDRKPPKMPWSKDSEDYSTFDIRVSICEKLRKGCREVFSSHDFLSTEDMEVARSLLSLGEEQISFALLVEALRREMYVQCIVEIGQNSSEFLAEYADGDEEKRQEIAEAWGENLYLAVCTNVSKMAVSTAQEVLESLALRR